MSLHYLYFYIVKKQIYKIILHFRRFANIIVLTVLILCEYGANIICNKIIRYGYGNVILISKDTSLININVSRIFVAHVLTHMAKVHEIGTSRV